MDRLDAEGNIASRPGAPVVAFLIVAIAAGIGLRFFRLNVPVVGLFEFRQTQTAFTARCYVENGINLMHSPLPIFGTADDVPMEMPLFQACAAELVKSTGMSVDLACRLTNLVFFIGSAGILYLLGALLIGHGAAAAAVLFYVWSPLTIYYSRAAMIEFMAVFFALAYALGFIWMVRRPGRAWIAPAVIVAGCGGALVKITTMATIVPIIVCAIILYLRDARKSGGIASDLRERKWMWLAAATSLLIPLAIGQMWVHHADAIKAAHPITAWLTARNLVRWNYGSLRQRLSFTAWSHILPRLGGRVVPGVVFLLAGVAILYPPREGDRRAYLISLVAGIALPILVFFNLFDVHDYYQCAISPIAALLCGAGLWIAWGKTTTRPGMRALLILGLSLSECAALTYTIPGFKDAATQERESRDYATGVALNELSPPDRYVVVTDVDWAPAILYFAHRKGLMWWVPDARYAATYDVSDLKEMVRTIGPEHFSTVVYVNANPELMSLWPNSQVLRQVGRYSIVRVW